MREFVKLANISLNQFSISISEFTHEGQGDVLILFLGHTTFYFSCGHNQLYLKTR